MSNLFSPRKFRSQRLHKTPPKGLRLVQRRLPLGYSGIGAADYGHLTWRVVEAGRRFITRQMRRARVYRRVALTQPITAKSSKSRMGKGKGKFKAWIGYTRPGTLLYATVLPTHTSLRHHRLGGVRLRGEIPLARVRHKFPFAVKELRRSPDYALALGSGG